MSNGPCQVTPHAVLIEQIMDSRIPKNEREHAAAKEIERLRSENDRLRQAMTEGARHLEIDGDEWGVAHLLRVAMTPNASLQPAARSADRLEGVVGQDEG